MQEKPNWYIGISRILKSMFQAVKVSFCKHGKGVNEANKQHMKSLFPKPLTSTPDMLLLICIIDFLLQLKWFKSRTICSYCRLLSFDVLQNVYKVIKSGDEWHAGVDRRGFGIKQNFIPLFFFMCVQNLWQGQKAVLTIVKYDFFDINYSKFQLVSTFFICSKFWVENCFQMSNM